MKQPSKLTLGEEIRVISGEVSELKDSVGSLEQKVKNLETSTKRSFEELLELVEFHQRLNQNEFSSISSRLDLILEYVRPEPEAVFSAGAAADD